MFNSLEEFKEFLEYKCNCDCEKCKYGTWLGDEYSCVIDLCKISEYEEMIAQLKQRDF